MSTWDSILLGLDNTALVRIARERRLLLDDGHDRRWVDLCWVDEVALALIDLADAKREDLTLVYPAPAGEVAVLLAAQLLLRRFMEGRVSPTVGIVTADTTMATRTWNALRISTIGDRTPIAEVFPCHRSRPDGSAPACKGQLRGVIIGQACRGWEVDHLIVASLAGPVFVDGARPSIRVVADPTDPQIRKAEVENRPIWGWSEAALAGGARLERRVGQTVPFSVASERLKTIAEGVSVVVRVAHHSDAEAAIGRVREDLRMLRSVSPRGSDKNFERGLSIAWHHLVTLCSLPCRPSRFDVFGGTPPIAARPTRSFCAELAAWSTTLNGDQSDIASILASDIADLRAAFEHGNPMEEMLRALGTNDAESLIVTRTHTAARALLEVLGEDSSLTVTHVGGLHRQGTWPRAVFVGEPSPWDWHRLLAGLAPTVEVFTVGTQSAQGAARHIEATRLAQDHWGSDSVRALAWERVIGLPRPPSEPIPERHPQAISVADGLSFVPERDPFEPLSSLFELDPLDIGGEGPASGVAREVDGGGWASTVAAMEIVTDHGKLLLEVGKPVDVRIGQRIEEQRPEQLSAGAVLLVGRREGRVGLLEGLEERLGHRPDLIAARFLVDDYRRLIRIRVEEEGMSAARLHHAMTALGCTRTLATVRSWVTGATMAPQHLDDLRNLNQVLRLGMSDTYVREVFAGAQRRRGFRRAAGRALAAAARDSTVSSDLLVDSDTGLTVADLRDAIIEAIVISVSPCGHPVPVSLLGTLEV